MKDGAWIFFIDHSRGGMVRTTRLVAIYLGLAMR
jgi:hypothetical protein